MGQEPNVLESAVSFYRQYRKTVIVLLWLLLIVLIIAYIFQIWNGVASIRMLQTASPNDIFKENVNTYILYQNLSIGTIVMSTLLLITIFFLFGGVFAYFRSMRELFLIVESKQMGTQYPSLIQVKKGEVFKYDPSLKITPFN